VRMVTLKLSPDKAFGRHAWGFEGKKARRERASAGYVKDRVGCFGARIEQGDGLGSLQDD
jgi:hypothetical protein